MQLAILRSLKVFNFNFTVDLSTLNHSPDWLIQQAIDEQHRLRSRTVRRRSVSETTGGGEHGSPPSVPPVGGGSLFGGVGLGDLTLFSALERGLDSVISQTVTYLNTALEGDEALSHLPSPLAQGAAPPGSSRRQRCPLFGSSLKVTKRHPFPPLTLAPPPSTYCVALSCVCVLCLTGLVVMLTLRHC